MSDHTQQQLHFNAPSIGRRFTVRGKGEQIYVAFDRVANRIHKKKGGTSFELVDDEDGNELYETGWGGAIKTYKSVRTAVENSGMRWAMSKEERTRAPVPLVTIFRPDDLEPANVPATERVQWMKAQIIKWRDRLFASGLTDEEMEIICESLILDFEICLRRYRERQST